MRALFLLAALTVGAPLAAQSLYLPGERAGIGASAGYLGATGAGALGARAGFALERHFDIGFSMAWVRRTVAVPLSEATEDQRRLAVALYVGGTITTGEGGPRIRLGGSVERLGGWDEGRGGGEATLYGLDLTVVVPFGHPVFVQPRASAGWSFVFAEEDQFVTLGGGVGVGYRTPSRMTLLLEPAVTYDGLSERVRFGAGATVAFPI